MVQHKKKREKPTTIIEKKVVQLCNYGVPRILCADRALHVAPGSFCDGGSGTLCLFPAPAGPLGVFSCSLWMGMREQCAHTQGG